ncbi:FtsX-like permease family protein [Macrococcoides canis]|uniref:Putative hemin transport system permease protein HrtB n=1 Tax=Macrococcoides canis TaxID=1855823 RepID=A0A4R6C529_9STAP|nr:FtsX-like permease family protein [Macrococcus canis]MEE1106829.1 FtsX-like permease family protein [Macrococcus canis]TDM16964.1 FtsX-like permease family protein [Macrococcus canis]TDM20243.1 FtsX-like permease family protein [Macrococcus canis]TDM22966.1 FtsX-like permease family protein [Macrococcus canis]TDM30813.1 FtsX-like permease family protein [Macrococcus canis]
MFLAWKEVIHNKLKFSLIIGVLVLVSYLLFLISGLSNGLMGMNREAIDTWNPDAVIVTEESNQNVAQSLMDENAVKDKFEKVASVKNLPVIIAKGDNKQNTLLFGINKDEFLKPNITEGKMFNDDFEVVADDSLKTKGFKLGDKLNIAGSDEDLKIIGFTQNSKYNAAAVLYANDATLDALSMNKLKGKANAFFIKDNNFKDKKIDSDLQLIGKEDFIKKLPGYTEQKLTLDIMSYFLFAISAFIIGIFLYVITIQKEPIFGLLKAQGISNGFLAKSLLIQTLILSLIAVLIALFLTIVTAMVLPDVVPIKFEWDKIALFGLTIIVTAIIGGLFSIRSIRKVDPLKTIE